MSLWRLRSGCGPGCLPDDWPRVSAPILLYRRLLSSVSFVALTVLARYVMPLLGPRWRPGFRSRLVRMALGFTGIKLKVSGDTPWKAPALLVSNHVSWLDGLAIVALDGAVHMVANAKAGNSRWFGAFVATGGTIFVDRSSPREVQRFVADLTSALRAGATVGVFPEGVTGCGHAPPPFRSAAFQAAIDAGVSTIPVTIRYRDAQGHRTTVPAVLPGEPESAAVLRVLSMPTLTVHIHVHPPLVPDEPRSRSGLAREAEAIVHELP